MADSATSIWRDWTTDGVPSSGAHKPKKQKIREWGAYLEQLAILAYTNGVVYQLRSSLFGNLVPDANTVGLVTNDPTPGYDGIYAKNGATLTGSWTRLGDLPWRNFIKVADAGAGTANAVQWTSDVAPATGAGNVVYFGFIFEANTGAVTFAINGGTAKPVQTASGQALQAGYLTAGMPVWFVDDGTNYRLTSDIASAATVSAAEAAAAAALGAVPSLQFASISALRAFNSATSAVTIFVQSYYAGLRCGGGAFVLDASDTTTADDGGWTIVDASSRRWKRLGPRNVFEAHEWGCKDDGDWRAGLNDPVGTDNYARIMAMVEAAGTTINELDGFLSDAEGSWGAVGSWATVGGNRINFSRSEGGTGIFGLSGTIVRPARKGLVFTANYMPRGCALMSLDEITDWKRDNFIIDFRPSVPTHTDEEDGIATGNNNVIGIDGLAFLRGGFRNVGNNGFSQEFRRFGVYGAPGRGVCVVDSGDMPDTDWFFPGTYGGTYTVVTNSTTEYVIRYTSGDALNFFVRFISTGSNFTYTSTTPTGGTFARIEVYHHTGTVMNGLLAFATGSNSNLTSFASAGLMASFAGSYFNWDGTVLQEYDGFHKSGVNNVHAIYEHFEIAYCYRGFHWESGTFLLARVRNFTIRACYDTLLTVDGFGMTFENGQLMGVIDEEAFMLHIPTVRNAAAYLTFHNINFGSEGGDTGTPYFNDPDANDFLWSGTPASDEVTGDWKYHPAKVSVLIGPRTLGTGAPEVLSAAPSAAGVSNITFSKCAAQGSSSGTTEYFLELGVGAIDSVHFINNNSFTLYKYGIVKESAVDAGFAPATNCIWDETNNIDGATCCTAVPAGKGPIFSEGGQGWTVKGISPRGHAKYGRRGKAGPLHANAYDLSSSAWARNGVTVALDAADRAGTSTEAWTVTCTHETTSLLQTNFSATMDGGGATLEFWAKQGTGGTKKIEIHARKASNYRYQPLRGFFIPDTIWRKFIFEIPEVDAGTTPTWVFDFNNYAVNDTVILGNDTWAWDCLDPPAHPIFYGSGSNDFGSISAGASASFTIAMNGVRAGDVVNSFTHNLNLGTYPLHLVPVCEANLVRITAYNGTAGSLNADSFTANVSVIPRRSLI